MHIKMETLRGAALVTLEGRFEFETRNDFKRVIVEIVQNGHRRLILDLRGVTFLDSAALGLLLLTDQNFKLNKGMVGLVHPTGYVRHVLEIANIPRVIPVFESVHEAVGQFAPV